MLTPWPFLQTRSLISYWWRSVIPLIPSIWPSHPLRASCRTLSSNKLQTSSASKRCWNSKVSLSSHLLRWLRKVQRHPTHMDSLTQAGPPSCNLVPPLCMQAVELAWGPHSSAHQHSANFCSVCLSHLNRFSSTMALWLLIIKASTPLEVCLTFGLTLITPQQKREWTYPPFTCSPQHLDLQQPFSPARIQLSRIKTRFKKICANKPDLLYKFSSLHSPTDPSQSDGVHSQSQGGALEISVKCGTQGGCVNVAVRPRATWCHNIEFHYIQA